MAQWNHYQNIENLIPNPAIRINPSIWPATFYMDRVYLSFRADIIEVVYTTVKHCLLYKSGILGGSEMHICVSA